MLRSPFCVQPVTDAGSVTTDHTNAATTRSIPHALAVYFSPLQLPLLQSRHFCCPKSILISCSSSLSRSSFGDHHHNNNNDGDYEAMKHSYGFLHRFQNPTIFLKISCDGDYVLPIVVARSKSFLREREREREEAMGRINMDMFTEDHTSSNDASLSEFTQLKWENL